MQHRNIPSLVKRMHIEIVHFAIIQQYITAFLTCKELMLKEEYSLQSCC